MPWAASRYQPDISDFFSSVVSKIMKYFILPSCHGLYWIGLSKVQSWKKRPKSFPAPKQDNTLFSSPFPNLGDNPGVNTHNTAHIFMEYSRNKTSVGSPCTVRGKLAEQGRNGMF